MASFRRSQAQIAPLNPPGRVSGQALIPGRRESALVVAGAAKLNRSAATEWRTEAETVNQAPSPRPSPARAVEGEEKACIVDIVVLVFLA